MQNATEESEANPKQVNSRGATWGAFLVYTALTIVMTWPVAAQLGSQLAGGRDDLWIHQWTFWWVKQAIQSGQSPFYTQLLYHPHGVSLTSHNIAWFNIALWLPLQSLMGNIAAYNLIFIGVLALNGHAMYLLAREIIPSSTAAFVGGVIYGFWPYTLSHYDHPNMIVIFWTPLTLLYLQRAVKRPSIRNTLLTALFLALIGITRWQLLLMSAPLIGGYLLYLLLTEKAWRNRRVLGGLLAGGLLAGVLMAPLAAPVVIDQFSRDYPEDAFLNEPALGRTDLLAYVTPNIHHRFWHDKVAALYDNFAANKLYAPFLGYTTILLALWGGIRRWQLTRFWLLMALAYLLLALGSELAINGRLYPHFPLPYRAVEEWLIFRIIRRPHRLNIFLSLPVAMTAAWGLATGLRQRAASRLILTGVIAAAILAEYNVAPFPTTTPIIPAWYEQLAQEPEPFAILDLPVNNRSYDKWYMAYQTTHQKPILGGHVSRLPREAFDFMESVPFLKAVLQQDSQADFEIAHVTQQLRLLADANVRYIVIHKRFANDGLIQMWRDWLTFAPFYEDDEIIVYQTAPQPGRDFEITQPLSDHIGIIRASFEPDEAVQGGAIKVDARWGATAPPRQDRRVCFQLINAAGVVGQSNCRPISPTWPSSQWEANEIVRGSYVLPVDDGLAPGAYRLTLTLADETTGGMVGETAVLGQVTIIPFQPTHQANASWNDLIRLVGYDLQPAEDAIEVSFYWQINQKTDNSYKVFVHLFNPATGLTVAQSDAVPRDWTYPTNIWEPGETVKDDIYLPWHELVSGQYELWVGLYDEISGERLPALAAGNLIEQEGAILLTTVRR